MNTKNESFMRIEELLEANNGKTLSMQLYNRKRNLKSMVNNS
jgi:hypothetical protein